MTRFATTRKPLSLRARIVPAAVLAAVVFAAVPAVAETPATLTAQSLTAIDAPYSETFDTLAASGQSSTVPVGFAFAESLANANGVYTAGSGATNAGDTYSFGTGMSDDRALGALRSGTVQPTLFAAFVNDTGRAITSFDISYTGEQWRVGAAGRPDRLDFAYSTEGTYFFDIDELDFTSPNQTSSVGALDGNAPENRTSVAHSLNLEVQPGGTVYMRWSDLDAPNADDGLAIDDFSMTARAPSAGGDESPSGGQSTSVTVQPAPDEVSISVEQANANFGSVDSGSRSAGIPLGAIHFTNTLGNNSPWSLTASATSLVGPSVIPFTAMQFTPGGEVTADDGQPGTVDPAQGGSFTGNDATPGTSYSDPLTIATAPGSAQGDWTLSGSTVTLNVPSDAPAGAYSGTIQYTVVG